MLWRFRVVAKEGSGTFLYPSAPKRQPAGTRGTVPAGFVALRLLVE